MINESVQLLRDWAEHGSEEAFARLVASHIDLVHSVAVRKVAGDTGLAADITQAVFTDLARKARTLRAEGSLAGWLHRHTCFTAATALRGELRRRVREQTAATMHAFENSSADPDWSRVAPFLDDAVNSLADADRCALLLRFYERRDLQEVGSALGIGEDAAQKRVARALDKLRSLLAARGVTSSASVLGTALGMHGVTAAPVGLAAAVTAAALATTAASAAGVGAASILELMSHAKTKIAVGAAVVAAIASPLAWQENAIAHVRAGNQALAAQIEPLDPLRAEHARLTQRRNSAEETARAVREREELEQLRQEAAALRDQLQQARTARLAAPPAGAASSGGPSNSAPAGFITMEKARDAGAATGEALLQTYVWAMLTGNTNRFFELGDWSGDEARGAAEMLHRVIREQGGFPHKGAAQQYRLVRQVPLEDGDAALVLDRKTGEKVRRIAQRIRRFGNEWRFVIGEFGPMEVKLGEEFMRD